MNSEDSWLFQQSQDILEDGIWTPHPDENLEETYEQAKRIEFWYELLDDKTYNQLRHTVLHRVQTGEVDDFYSSYGVQLWFRSKERDVLEYSKFKNVHD